MLSTRVLYKIGHISVHIHNNVTLTGPTNIDLASLYYKSQLNLGTCQMGSIQPDRALLVTH